MAETLRVEWADELNGDVMRGFYVVHPLDDVPEEKCNPGGLGQMPMTRLVRFSLMALRAYLIVMVLLVLYHALALAGIV
jgi:hypothetical protein